MKTAFSTKSALFLSLALLASGFVVAEDKQAPAQTEQIEQNTSEPKLASDQDGAAKTSLTSLAKLEAVLMAANEDVKASKEQKEALNKAREEAEKQNAEDVKKAEEKLQAAKKALIAAKEAKKAEDTKKIFRDIFKLIRKGELDPQKPIADQLKKYLNETEKAEK